MVASKYAKKYMNCRKNWSFWNRWVQCCCFRLGCVQFISSDEQKPRQEDVTQQLDISRWINGDTLRSVQQQRSRRRQLLQSTSTRGRGHQLRSVLRETAVARTCCRVGPLSAQLSPPARRHQRGCLAVGDAVPMRRLPEELLDGGRTDEAPRVPLQGAAAAAAAAAGRQTSAAAGGADEGPALSAVRQSVHVRQRVEDAHQDTHAAVSVPTVRQGVLAAVAATGSRSYTYGREAVRLSALPASVRRPQQPARAPADTLRRQAVPLRCLPTHILAHVSTAQAPLRRLRSRRHQHRKHRRRRHLLRACADNQRLVKRWRGRKAGNRGSELSKNLPTDRKTSTNGPSCAMHINGWQHTSILHKLKSRNK